MHTDRSCAKLGVKLFAPMDASLPLDVHADSVHSLLSRMLECVSCGVMYVRALPVCMHADLCMCSMAGDVEQEALR